MAASLKSRFRHYQNLKTTAPKLTKLLTEFRLCTMSETLSSFPIAVGGQSASRETSVAGFSAASFRGLTPPGSL